jgi:hypothetical protein
MPAPKPALKYQLLPELRELSPGNPAQGYLRCFAEQRFFFYSKEATAERARYLVLPLAELPAEKLFQYGRTALGQADRAARLDTLDWQLLQHVQTDGLDVLLPGLGSLQILAAALQVRFRAEVAGRHFDDAVRTAKTMFALARHLGDYPTEAANRLGLWVAHRALDTLEELLQQPGCPNFYWALTDLPGTLVELRKGLQGDGMVVATELRPLQDEAPMTEAQVEQLLGRLSGAIGFARQQVGRAPRNLRAALQTRLTDSERVHAARRRLVEGGRAEDLIGKFPPAQVLLLDEKRAYEIRRDERMKLLVLAPWQIDSLTRAGDTGRGEERLFADLLPDVVKARRAQAEVEQRIALLRHIEALRLYAAAHAGQLPTKLADVPVPLPADPFSGQPFEYKVEAATAHFRGGAPRGEEKNSGCNVHYELTLCK